MPRILFIFTSAAKNLTGEPTGWYLPEAAHPYYVLAPHFDIDFAAPLGPNPPVQPESVTGFKDDALSMKFHNDDEVVKHKLATAKKLDEIKVDDYVAIFYPGGHGPVLDLATDALNIKFASEFWRAGKIVSAVCHGPAALVGVTDASGKSIFDGRVVTAFTNEEEDGINGRPLIPFLVEDKIVKLGGRFEKGPAFGSKVHVDGRLITGQNPASAQGVGEALLKALQA
ncbi:class I glutamine amidotransferase-like protein [Exidia glandulosa HHB12029]|uniref:D-lactate dehydratase n=1 Tax=Exidia glandulosa HHB12029 TaxID=1314781 RepID=A0A165GR98_EXIGL|nr:class I glutamine amidotransferase-like protein [Exidia glandulosa HHB12029]